MACIPRADSRPTRRRSTRIQAVILCSTITATKDSAQAFEKFITAEAPLPIVNDGFSAH